MCLQVPYIVLYNIDERIDPGAAPTEPLLHPFLSVVTHINSSPNHLSLDVIAWQKKSNDMRAEIEVQIFSKLLNFSNHFSETALLKICFYITWNSVCIFIYCRSFYFYYSLSAQS